MRPAGETWAWARHWAAGKAARSRAWTQPWNMQYHRIARGRPPKSRRKPKRDLLPKFGPALQGRVRRPRAGQMADTT